MTCVYLRNLVACDASATDFASMLCIKCCFSALLLFCLAFFALFGASLVSLDNTASLNLSARGNSCISFEEWVAIFLSAKVEEGTELAHVLGSMSCTIDWSRGISGNASIGTLCRPWKPIGDGFGLTMIRGHSVDKIDFESSSNFGWAGKVKERVDWIVIS